MKHLLFRFTLLIFLPSCSYLNFKSKPDWENLKSFRMYDVSFAKPLDHITDAELDTTVFVEVPIKAVKGLLTEHCSPTHRILLYKTMTFCVLKFYNGPDRRFILANHSSFFTDLYADRMYIVNDDYRDEWMNVVRKYSSEMTKMGAIKRHPEDEAGIRAYYDSTEATTPIN